MTPLWYWAEVEQAALIGDPRLHFSALSPRGLYWLVREFYWPWSRHL